MPQPDVVETKAGAGEALVGSPAVDPPPPVATAAPAGPGSDGKYWAVGR